MKRTRQRTLEPIFARPAPANVRWPDIEALFRELGSEIEEREGSRVEIFLFGLVRVFHRPHPSPDTDKGAVAANGQGRNQWATEAIRQAAWRADGYPASRVMAIYKRSIRWRSPCLLACKRGVF